MKAWAKRAWALGASVLIMGRASFECAQAAEAEIGGIEGASLALSTATEGSGQLPAPAFLAQKLNPTGRTVVLTVPAKDGGNFLGDIPLQIDPDDHLT
ncbi:MAG: hypothetical protein ACKOVA_05295, partial [Novosphingobium sp.]